MMAEKTNRTATPFGKRPASKGFLPAWPLFFIAGVPTIKTLDSLEVTW